MSIFFNPNKKNMLACFSLGIIFLITYPAHLAATFPYDEPTEKELLSQMEQITSERKIFNEKKKKSKITRQNLQKINALGYSMDYQKMLSVVSHYNDDGLQTKNELVLYDATTSTSRIIVLYDERSYKDALQKIQKEHNIILSAPPQSELVVSKQFSSLLLGFNVIYSVEPNSTFTSALIKLNIATRDRRFAAATLRVNGPFVPANDGQVKIFLHRIYSSASDISAIRGGNTIALFVFRFHRETSDKGETVNEIGVFLKPEAIIFNNALRVLRRNDFLLSEQQKKITFITEIKSEPPNQDTITTYHLNGLQDTQLLTSPPTAR